MSMLAAQPSVEMPKASDLLTQARAIGRIARERAQQTEADRRVAADMIARMREADLFRVMQPEPFGGFAYGFDVFSDIVAAIASGCGSTGWVYSLLASHQWLIACFSREAQEEVWRDRGALAAGSYAPVGRAVPTDHGYRLSTAGIFCSGCDNAQWQLLGGVVAQPGGPPQPSFFLVPTADCTIDDNWHTMGLAGTGSKTVVAKDVFVPAHRAVPFAELLDASAPGMCRNPNPLYRQSFLSVISFAIVAPVLGVAEGALADFITMASARTTRTAVGGGNLAMAELAAVQTRAAQASALIDAARLLMTRDLKEAHEAAADGHVSMALRLRNRRDQAFCVRLLVEAIDVLFLACGGQGLFLDHPLQRAWRDAHAAGSHISLNWDSTGSMYGQFLLGLEPKGKY